MHYSKGRAFSSQTLSSELWRRRQSKSHSICWSLGATVYFDHGPQPRWRPRTLSHRQNPATVVVSFNPGVGPWDCRLQTTSWGVYVVSGLAPVSGRNYEVVMLNPKQHAMLGTEPLISHGNGQFAATAVEAVGLQLKKNQNSNSDL